MAAEPSRGDVALKSDELVLDNIFKNYITRWFREKAISAGQYEDAKKEIDFLLRYKDEIKAEKLGASARPKKKKDKANQRSTPSLPHNGSHGHSPEAHRQQIKALLTEIDNLKADNAFLHAEIADLSLKASKARPANKNPNDPSSQNERLRQKISKMEKEIDYWKEELARMRSMTDLDMKEKESQIKKLNKYLQESKIEIDSLRQRLSKLAGDKLKDGNPDIADLSDPYRPTQLAAHFSEVYDNEWSDAFEVLSAVNEDKRVGLLHSIVQMAMKYCEKEFKRQTKAVKSILLSKDQTNGDSGDDQPLEKTTRTVSILGVLKDIRKSVSVEAAGNIGKRFAEGPEILQLASGFSVNPKDMPEKVKKYAKRCAELCWLMMVCDPPMCLSEDKENEAFLQEMFKPYTRSLKDLKNPIVEMHVWPALHLHCGGPLVAKGVAQPAEGSVSTNM